MKSGWAILILMVVKHASGFWDESWGNSDIIIWGPPPPPPPPPPPGPPPPWGPPPPGPEGPLPPAPPWALPPHHQGTFKFKDPRDGQVYATITIGSQTWMAENLRYNVPGGSWDYNDDETYTIGTEENPPYGKLYSWEAVEEAVPPGWHLPTDEEWKVLESELGMSDSDLDKLGYGENRGTDQGLQLLWGGISGLDFLPAGYRMGNGKYDALGLPPFEDCDNDCRTYLWVNTTTDDGQVIRRRLNPKSSERNFVYRFKNSPDGFAISVRLVKDMEAGCVEEDGIWYSYRASFFHESVSRGILHKRHWRKEINWVTKQRCAEHCFHHKRCKFWSYNPSLRMCILKSNNRGRIPSKWYVSGNKPCGAPTVQQCPPLINEDALGPFFIPNTDLGLFGEIAPSHEVNLYVEGVVYDTSCRPVAGAKVEVWHASPHEGTAFYSCRETPQTCTWEPCTEDVPKDRGFSPCARQCIHGLCNGTTPSGQCSLGDQSDNWDESTLTSALWYRGLDYTKQNGHYWYKTSFPGTYNFRRIPHIHYKVTYPGGEEIVTQLYFEGKIPEGFNEDQRAPNQVKKITPCERGGGIGECITFHIYPAKDDLKSSYCPFEIQPRP